MKKQIRIEQDDCGCLPPMCGICHDCANTCRDAEHEDYMEGIFDSGYQDRISRYSLWRVITDWFSIRYHAIKERIKPTEFNESDIPF